MKWVKTECRRTLLASSLLSIVLTVCVMRPALAVEPDWSAKPVSIAAQEQPLRDFLQNFFAEQGIKVLVSDDIKANISGQFSAEPEKIFSDVVKAYGLLPYYDGYAMHISMGHEAQSHSIAVDKDKINKIVAEVSRQDLLNDHQSMQIISAQGLIKVRGAKQFVHDAKSLIERVQKVGQAKKPEKKVTRKISVSAPIKPQLTFKTFPLKYASAADVSYYQNGREVLIPGVATLLRRMVGDSVYLNGSAISMGYPSRSNVPGLRGKGLRRYGGTAAGAESLLRVNRESDYGGEQIDGLQPAHAATTQRDSVVRIQAERNLNAVIVRDYADVIPLYAGLIEQLDKEPQLVEIQVTIIDIDKNKLKDIGFDWRYNGNRNTIRFGGGDGVDSFGENGGLLLNTVIGNPRKLFARIRALAEEGSAKVVSRPQVLTLSNLEAVLQNDQSFFVRVAGNEEVDLFNVSAGTSLRVLPHVVGDEREPQIRLLVTIEDGVIVPGPGVDDIPIVERSSLSTQAIIFDGENLLLGGLVRDSTSNNISKVPLLGDLPGVGSLFKRTEETTTRTERLFLISPRIVGRNRIDRGDDEADIEQHTGLLAMRSNGESSLGSRDNSDNESYRTSNSARLTQGASLYGEPDGK